MRKLLFTIFVLTVTASVAQKKNIKLKEYTASNGVTYKVGGDVQLGEGSGDNGNFSYIRVAGVTQNLDDTSKNMLRAFAAGSVAKIKRIREYNYKSTKGVHFYVGTGTATNYMVNIERAIANCEVEPCEKQKGTVVVKKTDKYDQLAKIKKLYDEGVLSEEEYEAEKKKLLGS